MNVIRLIADTDRSPHQLQINPRKYQVLKVLINSILDRRAV